MKLMIPPRFVVARIDPIRLFAGRSKKAVQALEKATRAILGHWPTDAEVEDAIRSVPTHFTKSDSWENGLLLLLFQNANFANVGDATGLRGSTTAGSLYLSLHTADPGEAGTQATSEIAYTSYVRKGVLRASGAGGFTVSTNTATLTDALTSFAAGTGGSGTASYFGIGTASSGAGVLLYSGAVGPAIVTGNGITPQLTSSTSWSED